MKKYNYREIFIIIMVVLMIGSIAFITLHKKSNKKDHLYLTGTTKLKINNSTALTDNIGKKETSKDYSINFKVNGDKLKSKKVKYEIFIKQINTVNTINEKYIKVYLTEKNTKKPLINRPISFAKLLSSSRDIDARQIYIGSIRSKDVINIKLNMWLADTYTINNENKSFEVMVGVNVLN